MQPPTVLDEPGLWMIWGGPRFAFRQTLRAALLYSYERTMAAASWAEAPAKIVLVGQDRELDSRAIMEGWRDMGLPLRRS